MPVRDHQHGHAQACAPPHPSENRTTDEAGKQLTRTKSESSIKFEERERKDRADKGWVGGARSLPVADSPRAFSPAHTKMAGEEHMGAETKEDEDAHQSVVETLRRADEALRRASLPVLCARACYEREHRMERGADWLRTRPQLPSTAHVVQAPLPVSPVANASFGGASDVGAPLVSPSAFSAASPPKEATGSLHTYSSQAESQHIITANRLYGSHNAERPLVNIRQTADGSVEVVGRIYGTESHPGAGHSNLSAPGHQSFVSSTRHSPTPFLAGSEPVVKSIVSTEFLSEKAREILRQSGGEAPDVENKMWSSFNNSQVSGHPNLNRSLNNSQISNFADMYSRNSPQDQRFVRQLEEEMQSLRRKLHEEQDARQQTADRFRACSINLEQALTEKQQLQKALEHAVKSSAAKELQEQLETEVAKTQSCERLIKSLQAQLQAAQVEGEAQASAVRSVTGTLELKEAEIRRKDEELQRLHENVISLEERIDELKTRSSQETLRRKLHERSSQEATEEVNQARHDAHESRNSALALAEQLKRCVADLTAAQKRLSEHEKKAHAQDANQSKMLEIMAELKRALAESTDLNDSAKEELEFLRTKCRQLEEDQVELAELHTDYQGRRDLMSQPLRPRVPESAEGVLSPPVATPDPHELDTANAVQM